MASEMDSERDAASAAPAENAESDRAEADPREPVAHLTYQGTKVPLFVVLTWLAFFVWGVVYLLLFVPASVREWFRGG